MTCPGTPVGTVATFFGMAMPNFLIIGSMKAGTTSLSDALSEHPDVFIPASKEPKTLVDPAVLTDQGRAEYERLFARGAEASARGEASTVYTKRHLGGAEAARHARLILGEDLRLIFLVRDPIERAVSQAKHVLLSGEGMDLEQAIGPLHPACELSCYAYQLSPWLDEFSRENLLVIDMEDLIGDWPQTSQLVSEHLQIDPLGMPAALPRSNASQDARPPSGLAGGALNSQLYRRWMQERLPVGLRRRLRSVLFRRVEAPSLRPEDLRFEPAAIERLSREMRDFAALTGLLPSTPTLDRLTDA